MDRQFGGTQVAEHTGASAVWVCRHYLVSLLEDSLLQFDVGNPGVIMWYSGGKPASRRTWIKLSPGGNCGNCGGSWV